MKSPIHFRVLGAAVAISCGAAVLHGQTIFASGFNNPRGIKFGPDGYLYVAEGGTGGTISTVGQCTQVPDPVGPYTGSPDGARISKVSPTGEVSVVASGFPSSQTSAASGGFVTGVADVAFLSGRLYALISGAGCSHGVTGTSNVVVRVEADGSVTPIADLSAYYQNHPTAQPEPGDFEPDGTPYCMIGVHDHLYVVEPNHGSVERVNKGGGIQRVIDISATEGHIVPTSIAYRKSHFYLGNLGTFPIVPGSEKILRFKSNGKYVVTQVPGLSAVLGVVFDRKGRLYVLETTMCDSPCFPTPDTGRVVRAEHDGSLTVIADHLFLPTAMTFGPDGALYVSNVGFGPPPVGMGEILKFDVPE